LLVKKPQRSLRIRRGPYIQQAVGLITPRWWRDACRNACGCNWRRVDGLNPQITSSQTSASWTESAAVGGRLGHWEGNTLVVDTTNYSDKTAFRGSGENLHVTERFTRVDTDAIRYEFTADDPTTWTRSWSGEVPMRRMQGPLYEYACTEGNYGLANILRGARVEDAKAEAAANANPQTPRAK